MKKIAFLLATMAISQGALASCLATPIPGTIITSNYGLRLHPKFNVWKPHNGTDMRAAMMTPVNSAQNGVVTFTGVIGGGGNTVIIMGSDGTQTRYLHLSRPMVKMSQAVAAGDLIGMSGNTGEASAAPHLHLEARMDNGTRLVDPRSLMCEHLAEKPGAGPDSAMGDVKTSGAMPTPKAGSGSGSGSGTGTMVASGIPFDGYEGMGEEEILRSEVEKRFTNPEWYRQLSSSNPEAVRKEMVLMQSLDNWLTLMKYQSRERYVAMMSSRLAQNARNNVNPDNRSSAAAALARKQTNAAD